MSVKISAPDEVVKGEQLIVTASGEVGDRFAISWYIHSEVTLGMIANGAIGPYEIPEAGVLEIPFQHPTVGSAPAPAILMTAAMSSTSSGGNTSTVLVKIVS